MPANYNVPLIRDAFRNDKDIRKKISEFVLQEDRL